MNDGQDNVVAYDPEELQAASDEAIDQAALEAAYEQGMGLEDAEDEITAQQQDTEPRDIEVEIEGPDFQRYVDVTINNLINQVDVLRRIPDRGQYYYTAIHLSETIIQLQYAMLAWREQR